MKWSRPPLGGVCNIALVAFHARLNCHNHCKMCFKCCIHPWLAFFDCVERCI